MEVKAQPFTDADLFQNTTAPSSTGICMSPNTEFTFTNPIEFEKPEQICNESSSEEQSDDEEA